MLSIVGIIPARYHSTRFEGKPLANIAGKPMIEWTYYQAKKVKILERVIVATDDERIFRTVKDFGGEVRLTSGKHKSGTDRIAEVASKINLPKDGIVVNIQGDEPLIEPAMITQLVKPLLKDKELNMTTMSYRIRKKEEIDNHNIVKVVTDRKGYALYFSRSLIPYTDSWSKAPHLYKLGGKTGKSNFFKHLGLYAYRKNFLLKFTRMSPTELEKRERLEQLRVLENGYRIKVIESKSDPVEVDTPEDISKVLQELKKYRPGIA